ncbi:SD08430p [Talaromyces stipitatus ATCC 10500]|uniref:SD08430p n=1 Tax=Talaromyces stipitatus (strain ATCC 10500 / CBS 375.48 / QM 6759 / NRRL 1006) TaxID=441959 RepID=B8MMG4_TALSN|nr:SD08430p [Talaromyces stipitatus ATCC 10500]EED13718.1 SD08430p [Talaromyces stipitatus ATCC 10500]
MSDKQNVAKQTLLPAPVPDPESSPEQKDTKALDDLWKEAVNKAQKENGINIAAISESELDNLQQPDRRLQKASELFAKSRHPEDRKTKVIQAVSGCLDWTYSGVSFFKDHVSGTYAAPAQIVAGSVLYMIQAARNVSEDFDLIESTFVELHNALLDIGDLKARKFRESNFLNRLMDIFIAMLDFCLFSGKLFNEYRRRRLYMRALLHGRNKKIMARCEKVKTTILVFRATIPFQILDAVKGLDTKIEDLPANVLDLLHEKIKPSDLQALWGKSTSLDKITKTFKDNKDLDPDIIVPIQMHMDFLKAHIVPGTFSWIEDEPVYKSWMSGHKTPVIYVSGTTGTGKTFFSYRCFASLQEKAKKDRLEGGKNNPRQTTIVTYFPFEPGRRDSQSFRNVLAYILIQIADSDSKLGDSIAKDLAASKIAKEENNEKKLNFMWEKLLVKKFEKTPDTSRVVYIILDGVELMDNADREAMLRLFQTLNSDKDGVRILMTGSPDEDIYGPISKYTDCPKIDLFEKTRSSNDLAKLIDWHFNGSEVLKSFNDSIKETIKGRLLDSPERVMSSVDLTLTMLEQCDSDKSALIKLEHVKGQHGLYTAMIDTVCARRSPRDREIVEKIFALCTFAKQPFKVYELEQLLEQETAISSFDIGDEIQESTAVPDKETENENADAIAAKLRAEKDKQKQVRFRQPAFKDYLEQSSNNMIRDPIRANVDIFLKLVGILCDQVPQGAASRESLQEYAAEWLIDHLNDISAKDTTPQQGAQVVEALMRILYNDNDVSRVFEEISRRKNENQEVQYDMDFYFISTDTALSNQNLDLLLSWARKMSFHDEEKLSSRAQEGIEKLLKDPRDVLEHLARGHLARWTEKMTYREARISYNLIHQALWQKPTDIKKTRKLNPEHVGTRFYESRVTTTAVKAIIEYGKNEVYKNPVEIARCRIAAALILHHDGLDETRQLSVELYETNLAELTTLGPEKFYSYLGMAEYHRALLETSSTPDEEEKKATWRRVLRFADKALIERNEEKGALGSELRNERCIQAYLLKSQALTQLGLDAEAIATCGEALGEDLEYTDEILEFLKNIVDIHTKKGEWTKVIQAVRRQRPKIRSEWLWNRSDNFTDKKDSLRRAAVETRRVDFAIQIFEEAVEYWQTRDIGHSVATQFELAMVYRADARATKMAEIEIDKLITRLVENRMSLWLVDRIFPEMIDIHYENFMMAESKDVKRQIITQMEKIIDRYEHMQIVESLTIGRALLVLAEMWRKFDGELKAKQYAERVFTLCVADLEDSIGANDAAAFRLLAKLLMFANLEIDAKIALSLQFSFVNMSYDDSYSRKEDIVTEKPPESNRNGNSERSGQEQTLQQSSAPQDQSGHEESKSVTQQEVKATTNGPANSVPPTALAQTEDKENATSKQTVKTNDASTFTEEPATNGTTTQAQETEDASNKRAAETLPSPAPSEDAHAVPTTEMVEPMPVDSAAGPDANTHNGLAAASESQAEPVNAPADGSVYQDLLDTEEIVISCSGPLSHSFNNTAESSSYPRKRHSTEYELQDLASRHTIVDVRDEDSDLPTNDAEDHENAGLLEGSSESSRRKQMKRRSREKSSKRGPASSLTIETGQNGHAEGDMNSRLEMRRKDPSVDSPSSAQHANRVMARETFTLDEEPPALPGTPRLQNTSFLALPEQDRRNFLLLVLLYFLQGIPMGLAMGSVPFLLKPHISYGQIGVFSLASYPYSLKLLWSPIVDAVWSRRLGRRKSWITPVQLLSGLAMLYLAGRVEAMLNSAGESDAHVWTFTKWWFFLVFLCATQDIAVDGWALTLISPQNISYASTAQTVGLTAGHFLSYTVFLALNSPDFANRWFRSAANVDPNNGLLSLSGYIAFAGWSYIIVTFLLFFLKKEERTKDKDGIMEVYRSMWSVLKLKNIQMIIILHLIAKIGFQANEAVTSLKLIDKGFGQDNMALVVLIDFPFEIALGYYAGQWSTEYTPMRLWCWAFVGRLAAAIFAQFTVMIYPAASTVPFWYILVVIAEHVLSTFMNTVMFVAVSAFHARISDPAIGGTYMTLLATVSNLGGTFPKYFILKMVDMFTSATCVPPTTTPDPSKLKGDLITSSFSCALEADKNRCQAGGGQCVVEQDGYYITNMLCVIIGAVTFYVYIRPTALKLQALPLRAWRVMAGSGNDR